MGEGMVKKRVDVGNPFHEVWESGFLKWPWYANILLPFKRGKWWGEDADIAVKVKTLFGVYYVVATKVNREARPNG